MKVDQCQTLTKSRHSTIFGSGICLVPYGYTPAGFTIGANGLSAIATLHLRTLHKTKTLSPGGIFISCQPKLKKTYITTWQKQGLSASIWVTFKQRSNVRSIFISWFLGYIWIFLKFTQVQVAKKISKEKVIATRIFTLPPHPEMPS